MILERDIAPGVHRVEDAATNWYLVEDGGAITIVDTGHPRSWESLLGVLRQLGSEVRDIAAVVLTHAHFDHMGFTQRAREYGIPVHAHEKELSVVAHPWRYDHERNRVAYLRHPIFVGNLMEMTAMGALTVKGSEVSHTFSGGETLDVPGRPRVIPTPGHTYGHSSFYLPERGVLLAGDAFVTRDPYTGREGPCIVAGAATASSGDALQALEALRGLDVAVTGTGHGPVWRESLARAVDRARELGSA